METKSIIGIGLATVIVGTLVFLRVRSCRK